MPPRRAGARLYVDANGAYGREEAAEYVRRIADAGATAVVGLHAESALGTLVSLQQAAAIPAPARAAPAEQTFFLVSAIRCSPSRCGSATVP